MGYPSIALMGRARSGKDSVAARLVSQFQYTRIAFADPLREMALKVNPLIPTGPRIYVRLAVLIRDVGWEYAKDHYPEVRRLLQHMGQTVREYDEDFWLRIALDKAANAKRWNLPVVVTDVRYPNEAIALAHAGFRVVQVIRTGAVGSRSFDATDCHESETALDGCIPELTINNSGTLADLAREADKLAAPHG